MLSNLIGIYQKNELGKLSAYCGAVSAAVGAGAAIASLNNASYEVIEETIVNTLGNVSGIVCDGAKASCAAKIASSVDAAILAYHMASERRGAHCGEGLVKENAEKKPSKATAAWGARACAPRTWKFCASCWKTDFSLFPLKQARAFALRIYQPYF